MSTQKLFLIILGILFIGFIGYKFIWNLDLKYLENDPSFNRAYWSETIDHFGDKFAYSKFKKKNESEDFDRQHLASHVFGELLFEKEGVKGISTCDPSFGFGCYHGFFTRAVSENGLSIVKDLDKACVEEFTELGTGCQHGIGHGIMEYLGYEDIQEALDACKDTTQLTPLLGCSSGVFMEYRTPLFYGEGEVQIMPRTFDKNNPYDPCDTVSDKYKASCYFELANWWLSALDSDYTYMGSLCSSIKEKDNKKNCFLGIGSVIAPRENFNISSITSHCIESGEGENERDCMSGASWSFYADPEHRDQARLLCEDFSEDDKLICIKNADLTEGLDENHI